MLRILLAGKRKPYNEDLLSELNHIATIEVNEDVVSFWEVLRSKQYDIIFLDYSLSKERTHVLLRELREVGVPVVICAEESIGSEKLADLFVLGAYDFIGGVNNERFISIVKKIHCEKGEKSIADNLSDDVLSTLLNNLIEQVVILDLSGSIYHSNISWKSFLEQNEIDWEQQINLWAVYSELLDIDEQDLAELQSVCKELILWETDFYYKDIYIPKKNKWYTIRLKRMNNHPLLILTQSNITNRVRTEHRLIRSEERYRSLFQNITEGLVMLGETGLIENCNPSFEKMTGFRREELLGRPGYNFIPAEDVEAFKKRTARRKEGIKEEYEARLLNADKRFVWVSVSATPQYNEKGEYVGTLSILKDITSAKLQNIAAKISFEVAEKISKPNTTLEKVCQYIQQALSSYLNTENFYLALKSGKEEVYFPYFSDENEPDVSKWMRNRENGLTEYILDSGKGLLLTENSLGNFIQEHKINSIGQLAQSWVGAPVYSENEVVGVIACQSYDNSNQYSEEHLELLKFLGAQVGLFIQRLQFQNIKLQFFDNTTDLLAITDVMGNIRFANNAFTENLGFPSGNLIDHPFTGIFEKEEVEQINEICNSLISGRHDAFSKLVTIDNSGGQRIVDWKVSYSDSEGFFYWVGRDVTKEEAYELRIAESETNFRKLFHSMGEGMFIGKIDGTIEVVNSSFIEFIGYSEKELIGMNGLTALHDEETQSWLLPQIQNNLTHESKFFELDFISKSGERKPARVTVSPQVQSNGEINEVSVLVSDLTKIRRIETHLKRTEEELSIITQNAPNIILKLDTKDVITYLSRSEHGFRERQNFLDMFESSEKEKIIKVFQEVRRSKRSSFTGAYLLVEGEELWLRINVGHSNNGELIIVLSDKTEEKKIQDEKEMVHACQMAINEMLEEELNDHDINFVLESIFTKIQLVPFLSWRRLGLYYWDMSGRRFTFHKNIDPKDLHTCFKERDGVCLCKEELSKNNLIINNALNPEFTDFYPNYAREGYKIISIVANNENKGFLAVECADKPLTDLETGLIEAIIHTIGKVIWEKETELKLYQNDQMLKGIVNNSSEITLILNEFGIVKFITPAVTRVMGYDVEEVVGNNIFDYFHTSDHDKALEAFMRRKESGGVGVYETYRMRAKFGGYKYLRTITSNNLETAGLEGFVINAHDITYLINAEKEKYLAIIKTEENERKRISRDLHDGLGQSIAAANMYFNTLEYFAKSQLSEDAYNIYKTGKKIINRAAKETRIVSHNIMPPSLKHFGFMETVREMVTDYRQLSDNGINISLETNIGEMRFREEIELTMYRVIQELVNNAIKHAEAKNITIGINCGESVLEVLVQDDGKGFSINELKRSKQNGIGILSVNQRVEGIGGTLFIDSKIGKGSIFRITIKGIETV